MIDGVKVKFSRTGDERTMPPLSAAHFEDFNEQINTLIKSLSDPFGKPCVSATLDLIHAALRDNYPDLSREDVCKGLLPADLHIVGIELMKLSGFMRSAEGGDAGEAPRP